MYFALNVRDFGLQLHVQLQLYMCTRVDVRHVLCSKYPVPVLVLVPYVPRGEGEGLRVEQRFEVPAGVLKKV